MQQSDHEVDLHTILGIAEKSLHPFGADVAVFHCGNEHRLVKAAHEITPPVGRFYVSNYGKPRQPAQFDEAIVRTRLNYRFYTNLSGGAHWLTNQLLTDGGSNQTVVIVAATKRLPHIYLELLEAIIAERRPKTEQDFASLPRLVPFTPPTNSKKPPRFPSADSIRKGREKKKFARSIDLRRYLAAHGLNV